MAMPEATMNEDDCASSWKNQVRLAGQSLHMEPVSVTERMQRTPDQHLRLSVDRSDTCHHPTADIRRDDVSQQLAFVQVWIAAGRSPASA